MASEELCPDWVFSNNSNAQYYAAIYDVQTLANLVEVAAKTAPGSPNTRPSSPRPTYPTAMGLLPLLLASEPSAFPSRKYQIAPAPLLTDSLFYKAYFIFLVPFAI
jgi:hypothetical protein